MKRKGLSVILSVVLTASILAGCGGTAKPTGDEAPAAAASDTAEVSEGTDETDGAEAEETEADDTEVKVSETITLSADPAGNAETEGGKTGGTLRIGTTQTPSVIGYVPEITGNSIMHFTRCAYESLTYYAEDGSIVGQLAESWETDPEEPSITFHLLKGVKFSDGTDFNAAAVKWNIEQYMAASRSETNNIASIEVVDDATVKLVLKEWQSSTLEQVGFFIFYMSPDAVEKNGVDWARQNSCGTGPFVVSDFEQGVTVKYAKNENYHIEGQPYLDGITFTIFSDATTTENAFKANEIDVITYGSDCDLMNNLSTLEGISFDVNKNGLGAESVGLIPSSADESDPFYKAECRQALCYAVDYDTIVSALSYGIYQRTDQWAVPGSVTYNEDVAGYSYNPEKAKELLAAAGYPDGFETTLYTYSVGFYQNAAQAIAAQLAEVGIKANIEIIDGTKGNELMTKGWSGLYWHFASIGPDLGLYMGRHLDVNGSFYAPGIQHPQDALDLLAEIRTAADEESKIAKELELQKVIYDKYALFGMPLYINDAKHIRYTYVKGGEFALQDAISWSPATCWLDR